MRDVAALAGVGLKTVSRVINEEPNVRPETMRKVLDAAERLDYRPDINAGNLKRSARRVHTLGLVVGNVANPFSGAMSRAVEDVAGRRGTAVFTSSLDDDPQRETQIVGEMLRRRVDALILTTVRRDQSYLVREQERGTVLAFVDRLPSGILADTVVSENASGAALATRHLATGGHRRIAYLGDMHTLWTAQERLRGYREAMSTAGIAADARVLEDLSDEAAAYQAVQRMMTDDDAPTALFTSQNLVTIGALKALRDLGLQRAVALVGFDDIPLADIIEPGITVVAQDPYAMGRIAAERVFARLDGEAGDARTEIVPVTLVTRGSGEIPPRAS
ncbi:LacI family DNA-binding transcriptional regulator [Lysinimonas soli]|uniref:LacI family DNA-binding transcriptional regulator n=1 Tax=Lysinimonas soli TaxID=1074233 RepID=A0ABW0NVL1_9MICO